ncbi:Leucine--tRNA ligase [Bienertia sinuspersici]
MAAPAHNQRGFPFEAEWTQQSASIRITLGSLSLFPDRERYYDSSVPDYIAATIWFMSTTKNSHAYFTLIDGFISWTTKTTVVLLVSILITILMIISLVLCHKNLESISW